MVCQYPPSSFEDQVRNERDDPICAASGLVVCDSQAGYRPRDPRENVLFGVLSAHLETFLERQQLRDRPVPRFVERELRSFLECGVLAHGFLRVHCDECGQDRVVAFSCKGRGFCASCGGRRTADTAAHLVDNVLPKVPIRQWVLSLPFALRYRMAYDSRLVRDVLRIFVQAVFTSLRRQAPDFCGIRKAQCGAVTFIQRFGGAINLNVHFHSLVMDGVYTSDKGQRIHFRKLPPPDDAEVTRVTICIAHRILRLMERRGLGPGSDPDEADPLLRDQPLLAELYGASVQGRIATGPRAGNRITALGSLIDTDDSSVRPSPRCAVVSGVSLQANVCIPAKARRQLENLCRYAARPPVATDRLSLLPDGWVLYNLRHHWRDGTTHIAFEPLELVGKLAALVPPPRFNLVRYHGILAPEARWRPYILPLDPGAGNSDHHPGCCTEKQLAQPESCKKPQRGRRRNYSWAELMKRVFELDVLECPRCGGRMRILAAIHSSEAIGKILDCLGLPSRPPPIASALTDTDEPHYS